MNTKRELVASYAHLLVLLEFPVCGAISEGGNWVEEEENNNSGGSRRKL